MDHGVFFFYKEWNIMRQTTANGKEKTSDRGNCNNNIKRDRGKNNKKRLKKIKYNIKTVVLFR